MERKLKVGDSFEVVTCIGNKESPHAESVKGLTGIIIENESPFHRVMVNRLYSVNYGALLLPEEYKKIGKLTITKLKTNKENMLNQIKENLEFSQLFINQT